MRQEIKFCADVYRVLYQHLDTSPESPIYLCLDGSASERGVRERLLADVSMPDFFWRFKGSSTPFLMEAKVIHNSQVSFCGDGQPSMWCAHGTGAYKPALWLGIHQELPVYYAWEHAGFDNTLAPLVGRGRSATGNKRTLTARIPDDARSFETLHELCLYIVDYASTHGYYPQGCDAV